MKRVTSALTLALCAGLAGAEPPTSAAKGTTPEALRAEIDGLKASRVAWREIPWKTCLLDGLRESRVKRKPVLLWVFIDRPTDDARC